MRMVTTPYLLYLGGKMLMKCRRVGKLRPKDAQHHIVATPGGRPRTIRLHHAFTFQALKQKIISYHHPSKFCHIFPLEFTMTNDLSKPMRKSFSSRVPRGGRPLAGVSPDYSLSPCSRRR